MLIKKEDILKELHFKAVKSSGPGGQNVNKVNSRVELYFDIPNSCTLNKYQKGKLMSQFPTRITDEGIFMLSAQNSRSQLQNKTEVSQRFIEMLSNALKPVKKRVRTKPTKASRMRRLEKKRFHGEKKKRRRKL